MVALSGFSVPNFSFLVEGAGHNFVAKDLNEMVKEKLENFWIFESGHLPEGVIKRHAIDDIVMLVEREKLFTRVGIPNFTSAIVGASDELVSALVKGTVS